MASCFYYVNFPIETIGAYRALYILNWVYRSYYEPYYHHNWVVYVAGIIQTMLYADFFYYYVIRSCLFRPLHISSSLTKLIAAVNTMVGN